MKGFSPLLSICLLGTLASLKAYAAPVAYSGKVAIDGLNLDGTIKFKFKITDGSLWAMGNNDEGQLGDGSTTERHAPIQVLSTGVSDISAGARHTLIRMTDGSLRTVGLNVDGQLGTGRSFFRTTAVQVATGLAVP